MHIISLDNTKDNVWTVPNPEVIEGAMLSWDGSGGLEGDNAYAQFSYGGQLVYNKAIAYKDGKSLDLPYLGCFTGDIVIRIDKPGCTLVIFTKHLGSDFAAGK